jgi:hypothetical protein
MDLMSSSDPSLLAEAVAVWTGWGQKSWPNRDDAALLDRFGAESGTALLKTLMVLKAEFYSSNAWREAPNLAAVGRTAAEEFKSKHRELPDEIAEAFAWCYTYDWK